MPRWTLGLVRPAVGHRLWPGYRPAGAGRGGHPDRDGDRGRSPRGDGGNGAPSGWPTCRGSRSSRATRWPLPLEGHSVDRARATDRAMQHVADPAAAFAEIRRVLRPGGIAVLTEPDWASAIIDGDLAVNLAFKTATSAPKWSANAHDRAPAAAVGPRRRIRGLGHFAPTATVVRRLRVLRQGGGGCGATPNGPSRPATWTGPRANTGSRSCGAARSFASSVMFHGCAPQPRLGAPLTPVRGVWSLSPRDALSAIRAWRTRMLQSQMRAHSTHNGARGREWP